MLSSCPNLSVPVLFDNERSSNSVSPIPTVPTNVTFGLTIFYITTYCIIFLSVYIQLWLILCYNYKRFSFQTVFLYLCLFWSGLRVTLFSFYIHNTNLPTLSLPMMFYWLLYSFPVCLQFCTLCLLNLYFAQVVFKAKSKYAANPNKYIIPLRAACFLAAALFMVMNISCTAVVHKEATTKDPVTEVVRAVVFTRVLINDILFVICAIFLAYFLFKISKTTSANILLEAKGTTACKALSIGIVIVLLYTSRSLYNLAAISPLRCAQSSNFDFDWYNVSDQADLANLDKDMSYVIFGVVLFVWEFLPTSLTILFFKVSKPEASVQMNNGSSFVSRAYFFDNHQHYGSMEDQANASAY